MLADAEFVARPAQVSRGRSLPIEMLLETALNGQAVRLALNGRRFDRVYRSIHMAMRRRGQRVVVVLDADEAHVLAWVRV